MKRIIFILLILGLISGVVSAENSVPTAIFTVDRADDVGGGGCTSGNLNDCSLRSAITLANATSGIDQIVFDQDYTITLSQPLPTIVNPVAIVGGTSVLNPNLDIRINANGNNTVFTIDTLNVDIVNLFIYDLNSSAGSLVTVQDGSSQIDIYQNTIGDFEEATDCVNFGNPLIGGNEAIIVEANTSEIHIFDNEIRCLRVSGVRVLGSGANVGLNTSDESAGNRIERNGGDGITNLGSNNQIAYNTIQLNGDDGMSVEGDNNEIFANSILDNTHEGIEIRNGATGTEVYRNTIGRNGNNGIFIFGGALSTTIGCAASATTLISVRRNFIHDNGGNGIHITDSGTGLTTIKCNHIGSVTGIDGGNGGYGIRIDNGATSNNVGNANGGFNNIIRSTQSGILIENSSSNMVKGNTIGISTAGDLDKGNVADGITLNNGNNNVIGGTSANERNVISGNNQDGIRLTNGSDGNTIQGNYIGTRLDGTGKLANSDDGIEVNGSDDNVIGSNSTANGRNVIGGSGDHGILLNNAESNDVWGNYIGVAVDGSGDIGNTNNGIILTNAGSLNNAIGWTNNTGRNVINHNGKSGIELFQAGSGNIIRRNLIGRNETPARSTSAAAPAANAQHGIFVNNTNGTQIGTNTTCGGTEFCLEIVSNGSNGIYLLNADNTVIDRGAFIHANGGDGIRVVDTSQNNTLRPYWTVNNSGSGIVIKDSAINNEARPLQTYNNGGLPIDLGDDGFDGNDPGDGDGGPNFRLNYPVVTNATSLFNVQGTACNFCRVDIYDVVNTPTANGGGGEYAGEAFADANGSWSADLNALGFTAINDAAFVAIDLSGNTSEMSSHSGSAVPTAVMLHSNQIAIASKIVYDVIILMVMLTMGLCFISIWSRT